MGKQIVPSDWMPDCKMTRIIFHWTGGGYIPSPVDREHYHILIDGLGALVRGDHPIDDNVSTKDDDYAAHTRALNTKSIGVAVCAMAEARERPFREGPCPMTFRQWTRLAAVLADLALRYRIAVDPKTILSHAEVEPTLGVDQLGKWDIAVLPLEGGGFSRTKRDPIAVGDEMRALVLHAIGRRR